MLWDFNSCLYSVDTMVTPSGIEPEFQPWKGRVLTAWPWRHNGEVEVPRTAHLVTIISKASRYYLWPNDIFATNGNVAPRTGLEPVTSRLTVWRSANWATEEYKLLHPYKESHQAGGGCYCFRIVCNFNKSYTTVYNATVSNLAVLRRFELRYPTWQAGVMTTIR